MRPHRIVLVEMLLPTLRPYRKTRILGYELERIQPKIVDTLIRPKTHDIVYFVPQPRILPVQVRLLARKIMQVIGIGDRIIPPRIVVDIEETVTIRRLASFGIP